MRALQAPGKCATDEVEFAHWVRHVGVILKHAGIALELTPMITADDQLVLAIDTDDKTMQKILRLLERRNLH